MSHVYLFTLEVAPLEVGKTYNDLPSHVTVMSRFVSDLSPEKLAFIVQPLFVETKHVKVVFGSTIQLGPKKVTAHMIDSPDEQVLHDKLQASLQKAHVVFQYPQFMGANHKAHVTQRAGLDFPPKTHIVCTAAYLVEVVNGQRIIRSKFNLNKAIMNKD